MPHWSMKLWLKSAFERWSTQTDFANPNLLLLDLLKQIIIYSQDQLLNFNRDRSSRCMDVVQVMPGGSWGSSSTGVLLSDVFSNEMVHFSLFRIQVLYVLLGFKFVLHRVPSSSYNTPVFAPFIIKIRTEYSIQVRIITLSSGLAAFIIKILQDYCIAVQENGDDNYYGSSVDSCIVRTYVIHLAQGVKMVVYFFLQLERQLL